MLIWIKVYFRLVARLVAIFKKSSNLKPASKASKRHENVSRRHPLHQKWALKSKEFQLLRKFFMAILLFPCYLIIPLLAGFPVGSGAASAPRRWLYLRTPSISPMAYSSPSNTTYHLKHYPTKYKDSHKPTYLYQDSNNYKDKLLTTASSVHFWKNQNRTNLSEPENMLSQRTSTDEDVLDSDEAWLRLRNPNLA